MTHEEKPSSLVLSPIDIAVHTGGVAWGEGERWRRGIELASMDSKVDTRSVASTVPLSVSDRSYTTMVAEIQQATRKGWVELPYDSVAFYGINTLVAWALSAGYLAADYTPYFGIQHGTDYERLDSAFERLQSQYEPAGATTQFRQQVRPREAASSLGRVLATLGVPVGQPTDRTTLPAYLSECPHSLQRAFSHTYLNNRVHYDDAKPPACERQSPVFRRELAAFLSRVDEPMISEDYSIN